MTWFRHPRLAAVLCLIVSASSVEAAERKVLRGHLPEAVRSSQPVGEPAPGTRLRLALGLPLRNREALTNLLAQLGDPDSPTYRHYLSPAEFTAEFGPTEQAYQTLCDFAKSNGLLITATAPNRMLLGVSGSIADINRTFRVRMRTFRHPEEPRDFFAPNAEPSVEAGVPIADISGLSNYRRPHPRIREVIPATRASGIEPRGGSSPGGGYLGLDFRAAYLPEVSLDGSGQAVGLVQFDGFYRADIEAYETLAGLPNVPLQTVLIDGYDGLPSPGTNKFNGEVSLDIEATIAMAPGLARVIVYETGPDGLPNNVLNRMATDNLAKQLSCSWGWDGGPAVTTDQIFQQMAAQGQSFFCASGDSDAFPPGAVDDVSLANTPSDNPFITIVGGTTLTTSGPRGSWLGETVWNWGGGIGSSGGISSHYPIPAWQKGITMSANGGSATMRNLPDVALTADNVYVIYGNGAAARFGGTSCAAPLWAGLMALVNQQNAAYGLAPVGFANPALYRIASSANPSGAFHDVTTGNNISSASPYAYFATPGYDLCTGWGTPAGARLIDALAPRPDPLSISADTGFTSSRLVGWPFSVTNQTFHLTNGGSATLEWASGNTASWLTVSPAGGIIGSGATAVTVVSLNASAASLAPGNYTSLLWFTNLSTGTAQIRQFTIRVTTELIQNGGFEAGDFTGWIRSGSSTYTLVTTSPQYVHSGNHGTELGPSGSMGYLAQTLPTTPGQTYFISFWLENPKGGYPNFFSVSWGGSLLYEGANLPPFAWTNIHLLATATGPSSTLQFGFRNDPGYFGFDEITVLPVAPPTLQAAASGSGTIQLFWNSTPGVFYQVQYRSDLQTNWQPLGETLTAADPISNAADSLGADPQRYYRVVVAP